MNERKNSLEGIRAIACIGVFMCHFRGAFLPNRIISFIDYTPLRIMTAGDPMVRIMFVLSGFVISYKYFTFQRYDDVIVDVVKRWFRFLPGIFVANLLVCMLMKMGFLYNAEAAQLTGSEDFLGAFNQFQPNFLHASIEGLFATYVRGASGYIGPLWTMRYEFLGSLLILAAISVFKGSSLRITFYVVGLLFFSSYYNYLIIGMLICDISSNACINGKLQRNQLVNNIICMIAVIGICMIQMDDMNKGIRIIYGIFMVIFFVTLLNSRFFEKVLGCKAMIKLGSLSFAIYILHWPIIESFSSWYYINGIKFFGGGHEAVLILSNFVLTSAIILFTAELYNKYIISLGMIHNSFWKKEIESTYLVCNKQNSRFKKEGSDEDRSQ